MKPAGWQIVKHFVRQMIDATEFSKLSNVLESTGRSLTKKRMAMLRKAAEGWEI